MALAEIITIGDELLIGQVVDTNSAWMAQQLNFIGVKVKQITSVSDDETHIVNALNEASTRADIILMTGGLGPTRDDLTKYTLCKYFKSNLRFDEDVFMDIEKIFHDRGKTVTEVNRKQAEVPEKCQVLRNTRGTAPGMWFEKDGKVYVSLPGVPPEMTGMMELSVLPMLKKHFKTPAIFHKTVLTQGIGESYMADMIKDWEDALPPNLKLAYLPGQGILKLRLSGTGETADKLESQVMEEIKKLEWIIEDFIYGYDDDSLEKIVGTLLAEKEATICTAESCTGGYIAHRLTTVPGSSRYYVGSIVAYANMVKENFLDVPPELMNSYGAVSEEVVKVMAENASKKFRTTYAIACSGIAGPDGATPGKPVGTVWIAISTPEGCITRKLALGSARMKVIAETSLNALNMLRKILVGKHAYHEQTEKE